VRFRCGDCKSSLREVRDARCFTKMRASGVRDVLIYCRDHRCSPISKPTLTDGRISDIEPDFVCTVCGKRGADVRPIWTPASAVVRTVR